MADPTFLPRFFVKQKFAMMTNRYEIITANPDGSFGPLLGLAEQKKMALKEQVTFFSDETKTRPVFGFKARRVMDLNSGYDVTDECGAQIGFFKKDFGASLMRSTFHIEGPGYAGTGQERSQLVAIVRRFTDVPFLPIHFDYVDTVGPAAAQHRAAGQRARQVHGRRARPAGRLPGGRRRRRRDGRAHVALMVLYPQAAKAVEAAALEPPVFEPGFDIAAARAQARELALSQPREDVADVRDLEADGVPCRLYRPEDAVSGVVVHLHGGGFVFNDIDVHDAAVRQFANRAGIAVLSVDYRRPPEHRFPAAPDDVDTVLRWLDTHAGSLGVDGPTYAHGDSAGGNLALVAALRNPGRLRAIALIYPFLDPAAGFASYAEAVAGGFDPREAAWYWRQYAGRDEDLRHPDLAPLLSDRLHTLPPTMIVTAEHDPLRDEGEKLAAAARRTVRRGGRQPAARPGPRVLAAHRRLRRRRAGDACGRWFPAPAPSLTGASAKLAACAFTWVPTTRGSNSRTTCSTGSSTRGTRSSTTARSSMTPWTTTRCSASGPPRVSSPTGPTGSTPSAS